MAFFESLGKKASEATAKAAQQAKVFSETSKLNSLISEEEKKINGNYYELGKLYAAIHQNDYEENFAGMITAIAASERKIKAYRAQILEVKGVMHCQKCGAEVAKGSAFCSSCGNPMPKNETVDLSKCDKCAQCGALVEKGMRFCTTCGSPMSAPVVAPAEQPNVPEAAATHTCPKCNAVLEADALFCTECGEKIQMEELSL